MASMDLIAALEGATEPQARRALMAALCIDDPASDDAVHVLKVVMKARRFVPVALLNQLWNQSVAEAGYVYPPLSEEEVKVGQTI